MSQKAWITPIPPVFKISMTSKEAPRLSFFEIIKNPRRFKKTRTEILMDATLRFGDVVRLPNPFTRMYVASHPNAVRRVLVDNAQNYRKGEEYKLLSKWIGNGLITTEGEFWASDRRLIQPLFHREIIQNFSEQITQSAQSLVNSWSKRVEKSDSDYFDIKISEEMMRHSLVIIGWRLFGQDISCSTDEISGLMTQCQRYITNRMLTIDFSHSRFRKNLQRLEVIIESYSTKSIPGSVAELLTLNGYDSRRKLDQLMGFIVAGHETTAMALTWTLFLLSKHPEIQSRCRDHQEPEFIRAVVEESMRLYPPIPCISRRAIADDELMGFRIPAGSKIIVPQHVTHRRPDFWKNAEHFIPERFLPPERGEILPYTYFPFGMGSRICIGQQMAMLECQITLSLLLKSFHFTPLPVPDPKPIALISLRPDREVLLRATQSGTP